MGKVVVNEAYLDLLNSGIKVEEQPLLRAKHLPKYLTEKPEIEGVSKDEPRVVNELGGSQSRSLYDFTLADPKAMFEMCKVLKEGADKYGADNWRLIGIEDHLNHLLIHAYAYLAGDKSDEHLSHIMCRALFAQGVAVQTVEDVEKVKGKAQLRRDALDALRYPLMASDELPVLSFQEVAAGADMDGDRAYVGYKVDDIKEQLDKTNEHGTVYVNIDDLLAEYSKPKTTTVNINAEVPSGITAQDLINAVENGLKDWKGGLR